MGVADRVVADVLQAPDTALGAGMSTLATILRLLENDPGTATAATSAAAATGWAGWRVVRRALPIGVALYARIRKLDLSKHPARAALLAAIRQEAGATTRDLVVQVKLRKGTTLHHLRTLERGGLIRSRRVGRDRTWYDAAASRADPTLLAAMHAPTRRRILDLATLRPGITQAQLARELGFARATVHHHVTALRKAGLLDVRREGLRSGCFPRAAVVAATQ